MTPTDDENITGIICNISGITDEEIFAIQDAFSRLVYEVAARNLIQGRMEGWDNAIEAVLDAINTTAVPKDTLPPENAKSPVSGMNRRRGHEKNT